MVGKYDEAATIIAKFLDNAKLPTDTDDFLHAAAEHQARCRKHPQRIMYLSQTLTMYEHVSVLRLDHKLIMGLLKACSDDLYEAKEAAGVKSSDI